MQNLIATTFEVVHYIALQAVHYKPLQEVHLSRYNHSVGIHFVRDLEQGKKTLQMDKVNDVLRLFGECLGPVKAE